MPDRRGPLRVQQRYERHHMLPHPAKRDVVPYHRQNDTHQRRPQPRQPVAQQQRHDRSQHAVEHHVQRQPRQRPAGEAAVDRLRPVEYAGHQVFGRPEAALLPDRAYAQPCQHDQHPHHARLQAGQEGGQCGGGGSGRLSASRIGRGWRGLRDCGRLPLGRVLSGACPVLRHRRGRLPAGHPLLGQAHGPVLPAARLAAARPDLRRQSGRLFVAAPLADAQLEPKSMTRDELRGIGVIVGPGGGSQDFTEEQYRLYYTGHQKQCSVYTIPTGTIGTLASEVSMRFGFRGLSHIVSTGCTSSTDALGYAFHHIRMGSLSTMIAGGVDSPIAPLILRGFQLMRIMTTRWNHEPERASRPFSRDRDGFVIAEGAWFFVLEELEQARARGAHIYGEIAGYGSTCEAYHRVRLEECGEEPARAI